MKKIISMGLFLLATLANAQDTTKSKRLYLGIGPVAGSIGLGGNLNIGYKIGKKFEVKARGIFGSGKEQTYKSTYYGNIERSFTYEISASAAYYILRKTNDKFGLYVGAGAGYLCSKSNQIFLYDRHYFFLNGEGSNTETLVAKGLSANLCLGVNFAAGPGKIYIETYFASTVAGNFITTFTEYQAVPQNFNTQTYKTRMSIQNGYQGLLCLNIGYAIPF